MRRIRTLTAAGLAAAVVAAPTAALAAPKGAGPDNRTNNTSEKLRQAASAEDAYRHLVAFQEIAEDNGGTRASGTEGYDESVEYVVAQLRAAGYTPEVQAFEFPFFQEVSPAVLEVAGEPVGTATFEYSGAGSVTDGTVVPVDLVLPPGAPNTSTSGCEVSDFAGLDLSGPDDVALIQRGTCPFGMKALNAEQAGAEAVVIFNEGQPGRTDIVNGTLGEPLVTIPVVAATFEVGAALAESLAPVTVRTETFSEVRDTFNVTAELPGRTDDNVVMAGAHLDSVLEGPGINDNASGSAALLEVALDMAKVKPTNTVRFAWWGAEEWGLLGAEHYVANLSPAEVDEIAAYLNFDMVASPNFVRFVYDGDDSDAEGAGPGPEGSAAIEDVFTDYFTAVGLASQGTDFTGRSDYGPFISVGVPAGGLFTGAEGVKTPEQAAVYGGVAGEWYDPCYHQECDSLEPDLEGEKADVYAALRAEYGSALRGNVNMLAFEQNIDAIAHAILTLAYDTSAVNGVVGDQGEGKTRVTRAPGGGVHGGSGDTSGGGLHDDHDHELPVA